MGEHEKNDSGIARENLVDYPKQDESELEQMADFYAKQYGMVYFVRCLNCKRVIAVEVPQPGGNTARGMQIFGYQNLFMTTRTRLDKTPSGKPMIGYECACGNDTRLSEVERGVVPTHTTVIDKSGNIVSSDGPLPSLSPFERDKMRKSVAEVASNNDYKADYEADGVKERYETFIVERVK